MIEAFSLSSFVIYDLSDSSKDCNYAAVLWAVTVPTEGFLFTVAKTKLQISATRGRTDTRIDLHIVIEFYCPVKLTWW